VGALVVMLEGNSARELKVATYRARRAQRHPKVANVLRAAGALLSQTRVKVATLPDIPCGRVRAPGGYAILATLGEGAR
jgi:hypothetical protein